MLCDDLQVFMNIIHEWLRWGKVCPQCRSLGCLSWVGKIPWKSSPGQSRILPQKTTPWTEATDYTPWGPWESNEWVTSLSLSMNTINPSKRVIRNEKKRFGNMTLMLKRLNQKLKSIERENVGNCVVWRRWIHLARRVADLIRPLMTKSIFKYRH